MDDLEAELQRDLEGEFNVDEEVDSRKKIKRPRLPLVEPTFKETRSETGFHRSGRLCLGEIRDALLHHRWQEASEYMSCFSQAIEDTTSTRPVLAYEIVWRLGTEILLQQPDSTLEDLNSLYEQMKNAGVKNYLKVCLEHSFHLLVSGHVEDAKQQLSMAEAWRYGKQSACQPQKLMLIHGYRGLLDYFIWRAKRSSVSTQDDAGANQEMHGHFRQSSTSLHEIIQQPGVWDPFVLAYVDMLEFYGDHEGALRVLKDYAYDPKFPPNPNGHVYLYHFLKGHQASPEKQRKVLKILHALVPSHELMLEYGSLLLQSEMGTEELQEALRVAMGLLDYAGWKSSLEAWSSLLTVLKKLKSQKAQQLIGQEWEPRKDWWTGMHYQPGHARKDFAENVQLLRVKMYVCYRLIGRKHIYCKHGHKLMYQKIRTSILDVPSVAV